MQSMYHSLKHFNSWQSFAEEWASFGAFTINNDNFMVISIIIIICIGLVHMINHCIVDPKKLFLLFFLATGCYDWRVTSHFKKTFILLFTTSVLAFGAPFRKWRVTLFVPRARSVLLGVIMAAGDAQIFLFFVSGLWLLCVVFITAKVDWCCWVIAIVSHSLFCWNIYTLVAFELILLSFDLFPLEIYLWFTFADQTILRTLRCK